MHRPFFLLRLLVAVGLVIVASSAFAACYKWTLSGVVYPTAAAACAGAPGQFTAADGRAAELAECVADGAATYDVYLVVYDAPGVVGNDHYHYGKALRFETTECGSSSCTKNQTATSGYFDVGTSPGSAPVILGCKAGCEVVFDGISPAGSGMVGGVKHYFAKGEYVNTGNVCASSGAGSQDPGTGTSQMGPADTADKCAPGQVYGTVNGKGVCVDSSTGETTEASKPKSTTTSSTQTTNNPDGSTTTTETTTKTDSNGKQTTTTTSTTTNPDGSKTTTSTTTGPGMEQDEDDAEETECQKNPSGKDCGGAPAEVGELRTKGTKTFGQVLTAQKNALLATPVGSAVGGFFNVSAGGSCPSWTWNIPYINAAVAVDMFCTTWAATMLLIIKGVLLVVAAWYSFRIIVE